MSFFFLLMKLLSFQLLIRFMISHHVLTNILITNFCNYFVTKRSLNNTPYRKFSLTCKQHSKTRKELNLFKLNVFLTRFLPYLHTARIQLNFITFKAFWSRRFQIFYKIGVFKNFAKFTGKLLRSSHHFLMRTLIFSSPLKIKQRFCVNKLAK